MKNNYDQIKKYIEADIDNDVRLLISDFALLWGNYERELFSNEEGEPYYKFKKILDNSTLIINDIFYKMDDKEKDNINNIYEEFINYFERKNGEFNKESFVQSFKIRNSDIENYKLDEFINNDCIKNRYLVLLLMVGRVRNNMFHGIKLISELNEQKELFEICNKILTITLELTRKLYFKERN